MRRVFFYGLFMDVDDLARRAFKAKPIGTAELPGFELRIGDRATLIENANAVCYGVLVAMSDDDLHRLYSEPGVADYRAETVRVRLLSDASEHVAQCYNLPASLLGDVVNVVYARQLARLARRLGVPADYVSHIDAIAGTRVLPKNDAE